MADDRVSTTLNRYKFLPAALFGVLFFFNIVFGSGIGGAFLKAFIFTLVLSAVALVLYLLLSGQKKSSTSPPKDPLSDEIAEEEVTLAAPKQNQPQEDDILRIVTKGKENAVPDAAEYLEDTQEAQNYDLGIQNSIIQDSVGPIETGGNERRGNEKGAKSESENKGSGQNQGKKKNLGKYVLINKRKIENDPENFANAIRTMMARDDDNG